MCKTGGAFVSSGLPRVNSNKHNISFSFGLNLNISIYQNTLFVLCLKSATMSWTLLFLLSLWYLLHLSLIHILAEGRTNCILMWVWTCAQYKTVPQCLKSNQQCDLSLLHPPKDSFPLFFHIFLFSYFTLQAFLQIFLAQCLLKKKI